ncbi:hypothetical protein WG899_04185 [Paucibacter sp. AS339]|uniref:hypothetical protein n=1 Tax=Paucibacter hankyongi TaxID=3133434 RepID=UPI0030AC79F9
MRLVSHAAVLAVMILGMASAPSSAAEAQSLACSASQRLQIEFHSAFLPNLHHFLLDSAKRKQTLDQVAWSAPPSAAELQALGEALAFYTEHYAQRDPLFDEEMATIRRGLAVEDERHSASGLKLPPALIDQLNRAAPAYERLLWAEHNRLNQTWIHRARALDAVYGAEIQSGIERHLAGRFSCQVIRNDVVARTGTRQGAYTATRPPHTVLPSARADYQGLATLEMLYHEASHVRVVDALIDALDQRLGSTGRARDSQLWHAVQFYTVGEAVRAVLHQRSGIDYLPYAEQGGLYARAWPEFLPLLEGPWRQWMQGKLTQQQAIDAMVEALPLAAPTH